MNSARVGGLRALAGSLLVALLISAACGLAAAPRAAASGVWLEPSSAGDAAAVWTPDRVREARPVELRRETAVASAAAAGEFGSNFEEVADPTAPEFRIHGVILLSFGILGYGRCSGTAVHSANKSVVITAGHCVNSGRGDHWLAEEAAFVPGYRYGQRPFGIFPVRWIDSTRRWAGSGNFNYDVGAMDVGRNGAGELLGEAVGGAKIAWGLKPRQDFVVHGYPAEEPFDGETQRVCGNATYLGHDPQSLGHAGPQDLAVRCDVTGGASGGGWLIHGDTLNGVTSYGYFDQQTPDYGPYFGKEVGRLYGRAARMK